MPNHEISNEIRSNFHLFWDNFPFPVLLVHKDRTIIERNKTAEAVGYVAGTRCVDMGKKEDHKDCLANQALKEQTAKRMVAYFDVAKAVLDSYWVPLAGAEDLYIHYAADISAYAADDMFPSECGAGCASCNCG